MNRAFGIYPASAAVIKPTEDGGLAINVLPGGVVYDNSWAVDNLAKVTVAPATDNAGVPINPATGKPSTGVPGYISELAGLIRGEHSTDPVKDTTTYGPATVAVQHEFRPGKHYDIPFNPAGEKHVWGEGLGEIALHFGVPAGLTGRYYTLSLAGTRSGTVNGGAQWSVGEYNEPPPEGNTMEGQLQGLTVDFDGNTKWVNIYLRRDGGDPSFAIEMH